MVGRRDELLKRLAGKYIWWKTPEESIEYPNRVIAQVMNLGVPDDVQALVNEVGDDCLRLVIKNAEAGQFGISAWEYWHRRLGLAVSGQVPPLPKRTFG